MKYLLLLVAAICASAQTDPWKDLQFLSGEWVAEGAPGACSFTFDLQRKIIVRKNLSEAPTRHEDLMVIYVEKDLKAIYFDNEGHVIHYTVEAGPDMVRFVSDQYRLTYRKTGEKLALDFEIAPPGKPFANYLHATLRRK
jgi:hypothetical protein